MFLQEAAEGTERFFNHEWTRIVTNADPADRFTTKHTKTEKVIREGREGSRIDSPQRH
jgi:hypothetical protein